MKRIIVLALCALPACMANQGGHLAATGTGTRIRPAERRDAMTELRAACGAGRVLDGAVARVPYLQRLGGRDARVLWTTTSRAPAIVSVTTPDGATVGVATAREDRAARVAGQRQLVARLGGLQPSTTYCYEIREGDRVVAERAGFRTAPATGSGAPVRFVAWGDSGSGNADQRALTRQIGSVPFDFMIHTGDVAYPSGDRASFERTFFQVYAPLLRHFVDYPVAGNHEYKTDGAAPFREVFDLPGNERWYSFDWGDVHMVAVDTEQLGRAQAEWLAGDLAATRQPWTILFLHRPPFSNGKHGSDLPTRDFLVPILKKHPVDLVLAGHEHNYERTRPIEGITYVVTGGGGNGTRPVGKSIFTAFSEDVIHFVYITIEGDRLRLHAIDAAGREFDGVTLGRRDGKRLAAVSR
jgi:acid phosphatase type 7